ncbi:MAG: sigma-70 family RNA polymerase sigma factor [Clostridia bacterium]|nr:sigma-70 family RNA polymerase sigma factor [Clostridia bacterium]
MAKKKETEQSMYEQYIVHQKLPERMSAEEEKECYERYYLHGDMQAREKIIIHNLRLIKDVIFREYPGAKVDQEDLFSMGLQGLVKAVDEYDLSRECTFSTFAYPCIKHEIGHFFIMANYAKRKGVTLSMETTPMSDDSQGEEGIYLKDMLVDEEENTEENVVDKLFMKKIVDEINNVLNSLDERTARIFSKHFGINGWEKMTYREIAEQEGITYQRCEQIISKTLIRVRQKLKAKRLVPATSSSGENEST